MDSFPSPPLESNMFLNFFRIKSNFRDSCPRPGEDPRMTILRRNNAKSGWSAELIMSPIKEYLLLAETFPHKVNLMSRELPQDG